MAGKVKKEIILKKVLIKNDAAHPPGTALKLEEAEALDLIDRGAADPVMGGTGLPLPVADDGEGDE